MRNSKICFGSPRRFYKKRERETEREKIFEEITAENFPDMVKSQIYGLKKSGRPQQGKIIIPRHIIIKLSKTKKKILRATRKKQIVVYPIKQNLSNT